MARFIDPGCSRTKIDALVELWKERCLVGSGALLWSAPGLVDTVDFCRPSVSNSSLTGFRLGGRPRRGSAAPRASTDNLGSHMTFEGPAPDRRQLVTALVAAPDPASRL